MKKICVYTCITGQYDELKEVKKMEPGIDYICFTNNKEIQSKTWKIIPIRNNGLDNIRLARKIKILGHKALDDYEITVWLDAAIQFETSIQTFIEKHTDLKNKPFAAFKHHERDCIYEEAKECVRLQKETKDTVLRQLNFYEQEQFPHHGGLHSTGCLIRNMHHPTVKKAMKIWFQMVKEYSVRDQLSCNYAIYKTQLPVTGFDLNIFATEYLTWIDHIVQEPQLKNYRIYFGEENDDYQIENDMQGPYQIKDDDWYECQVTIPKDTEIATITINCPRGYGIKKDQIKLSVGHVTAIEPTIHIDGYEVFTKNRKQIKLNGNFHKGSHLKLKLKLIKIDSASLTSYYEQQLERLSSELAQSLEDKQFWKQEAEKVLKSKIWKASQPIRAVSQKIKQGTSS